MSKRTRSTMLARNAFDCSHVKSVNVWALTHPDHPGRTVGRIIANWSDNPMGSVVTATVHVFQGPLKFIPSTTGQAGGGGYCKLSAAISDGINRARESADYISHLSADEVTKLKELPSTGFGGGGHSAVAKWFAQWGYQVDELL
jgi:hypothetical protein